MTDPKDTASLPSAATPDWRHTANEWADMATNGIQWMKNVRDGISTPEQALAALERDLAHCRSMPRPADKPAAAPAGEREAFEAAMRRLSTGEPDWKSPAALWAWEAWQARAAQQAPAPSVVRDEPAQVTPGPLGEPAYYVRHPDDTFSLAQPQPVQAAAPSVQPVAALEVLAHIRRCVRFDEASGQSFVQIHEGSATMADIDAALAQQAAPERHATKESGDCPHWCRACASEAEARAPQVASAVQPPEGWKLPELQELREAMAALPMVPWSRSKNHVYLPETEDWASVDVECRANRLINRKVARYIAACNPVAMSKLLALAAAPQQVAPAVQPTTALSDGVTTADALKVLAEFAQTAPGRLPQRVADAILVAQQVASAPTTDPLDTPLPCRVDLGGMSFGKGVALRLLVEAARRWKREAYPPPTDEQKAEFRALLQGRPSAGEKQHD